MLREPVKQTSFTKNETKRTKDYKENKDSKVKEINSYVEDLKA